MQPTIQKAQAWIAILLALLTPLAVAGSTLASATSNLDDESLADRPVASVELRGLGVVTEQEIRNNLRVAAGQPFDASAVRDDVTTLYRLGHFDSVTADAELLLDGTVKVSYIFVEQPIVQDIQVVGNKSISDQELRGVIALYPGGPRDDFLLERAVFKIKDQYRSRGHYLVEVKVDETRLVDTGILIFRIIEGPRVRIRDIEFVGVNAFESTHLGAQIKTKPWVFIFQKGQLDEEVLVDDVSTLDRFYKDRGYMDVRVGHRIEISADGKEAKVVFVIEEGRLYYLRSVMIEGSGVDRKETGLFSTEQIKALLVIRPGDPFTQDLVQKSVDSIRASYQSMGYAEVQLGNTYVRIGEAPEVDMIISIMEGGSSIAGIVRIQGNSLTKDNVVRRLVRILPGRTIDAREMVLAKERLQGTRLFNDVRVTLQQPDAEEGTRDVLVEVKEKNTGSVNFGIGAGTDSGFFGEVSLQQHNFDIADYPRTMQEFLTGRAFRGAGQSFNLSVAPGIDLSTYSVSVADPHLFDSEFSGSASSFYRQRIYPDYNEDRLAGIFGLGKSFGDVWAGGARLSLQSVQLDNFDPSTPIEMYEQRGPSFINSVGLNVTRTTTDNNFRPSSGSRVTLGTSYFGAMGGDYHYPAVEAGYTTFFTLDEDFFGRKSVLRLSADVGYIFSDSAPVFERYYLGGRSLRGFQFHSISPLSAETMDGTPTVNSAGTPDGDPIGGQWKINVGTQYEIPVFDKFISMVFFCDTGTVTNTVGFDQYRASLGTGLRLYIPQLGPVPLAFDFAVPIMKQETDQTQVFSFNAELPF